MALEDFGTYTEVDADGDISRTATRCSVVTMKRDANSYVYKDMDPGHFGDFEHLLTVYWGSVDNSGVGGVWGLSNGAHTLQDKDTADLGLRIQLNCSAGDVTTIYLVDDDAGLNDGWGIGPPCTYYLTIKRAGTALTCKLYTDADRTILAHTLSVVGTVQTYRYIETIQSRDAPPISDPAITYYVENLDLQEVVAGYAHSWGVIF